MEPRRARPTYRTSRVRPGLATSWWPLSTSRVFVCRQEARAQQGRQSPPGSSPPCSAKSAPRAPFACRSARRRAKKTSRRQLPCSNDCLRVAFPAHEGMDHLRSHFIERRVEGERISRQFLFVLVAPLSVGRSIHSMETDAAFASPHVQPFCSRKYHLISAPHLCAAFGECHG